MFNVISQSKSFKKVETSLGKYIDKDIFKYLLVGNGKDAISKIILRAPISNDRQAAFMAITGFAFTCMVATRGDGIANMIGRSVVGLLATAVFTAAVLFAMSFYYYNNSYRFGVVNKKGTFSYWPQSIPLFLMLCGLNYMGTRGFEYMTSFVLSSDIAKAAGFVMASLVSIYPSKDLRNDSSNVNASTVSGLMGFVAFTACAAIFKCTRLGSFKCSMLLLKAIPIFLACTEAIYEEEFGAKNVFDNNNNLIKYKASAWGTRATCTLGSAIITAAFVGGDLLTTRLCSTGLLSFAAELALTPVMVIAASLLCRSVCNFIGNGLAVKAQ